MDLNQPFDRQVWQHVYASRCALEAASCNAERMGCKDLAAEIYAVKEQTLTLLARCAAMAAKQDTRV